MIAATGHMTSGGGEVHMFAHIIVCIRIEVALRTRA
jgi:hypothetical protein